jgi:hypothetical protein
VWPAREAALDSALPRLLLSRSQVRAVHAALGHDPAGGEAQCAGGHICSQSVVVAQHENRTCIRDNVSHTSTLIRPITSTQVVQLTSLRPTADLFCSLLRDALKAELNRGQMKAVKSFIQTCYSETLLASVEGDEKDGGPKVDTSSSESLYLGGLGLRFKYPGDPRKYVHATSAIREAQLDIMQAKGSIENETLDYLSEECVFHSEHFEEPAKLVP